MALINVPFDGIFRKLDVKGQIRQITINEDGNLVFPAGDLGLIPKNYSNSAIANTLAAGTNTISYGLINPPYIWGIYSLRAVLSAAVATTLTAFIGDLANARRSSAILYAAAGTTSVETTFTIPLIVIPPDHRLVITVTGAAGGEILTISQYFRYDLPNVVLR